MWEGLWQIIFVLWLIRTFFRILCKMTTTDETMPDVCFSSMWEHLKHAKKFRPIGGLERFKILLEKSMHKDMSKFVKEMQSITQVDYWAWVESFN